MNQLPVIAITAGEPAGIGPDLIVSLASKQLTQQWPIARLVVIADPQLIHERARELGQKINLPAWSPDNQQPGLYCQPVTLNKKVTAGTLDSANSPYVVETLRVAAQGCLDNKFQAMVTGPVHKGIINAANIPFTGHTEFLEQLAQVKQAVMMLATEKLKVALVTTHLPLKDVPENITRPRLQAVIEVLHRDLRQHFDLPNPHIAVCGLNPHAGESGHLGKEEIEVIEPVLATLRQQGVNLSGPFSADTIFTEKNLNSSGFDVVLAMYHDQGLPVIKHAGFGQTVNITLGLPFIRTSVDHGTALNLAGKNSAVKTKTGKSGIDSNSMILAINLAIKMTNTMAAHARPVLRGTSTSPYHGQ